MQDDQNFGQPAFMMPPSAGGIDGLLEGTGDIFDYPLSAPVTGPDSFWDDTTLSFSMDTSFMDPSTMDWNQPPPTPSHRPSNSFDYNNEVNLFAPLQPAASLAAPAALSPTKPEPARPTMPQRRERPLAPKPPAQDASSAMPSNNPQASAYHPNLGEPFTATGSNGQAGSFVSRPQTAGATMSFQFTNAAGVPLQDLTSDSDQLPAAGTRRLTTARGAKNGNLPNRASASSPIKPSNVRPGLGRSFSEARGRKSAIRHKMANQSISSQGSTQSMVGTNQVALPSGRISPVKALSHAPTLRPIPEAVTHSSPGANVEFLIVNGRAEARFVKVPPRVTTKPISHSSGSSEDSSDDDEPIQLPNQAPSRNTSFALPDPLKPVGSIFSVMDDRDDVESEAETIMNETSGEKNDAISEIHRVLERRQRQMKQGSGGAQRFQQMGHANLYRETASPESLASAGLGVRNIRCVCSRTSTEKDAGYLLKCDYCEYWLHGECVNIDQPSRPQIYVCRVCATGGGRVQQDNSAAYTAVVGSPLASKSFKGLR